MNYKLEVLMILGYLYSFYEFKLIAIQLLSSVT